MLFVKNCNAVQVDLKLNAYCSVNLEIDGEFVSN